MGFKSLNFNLYKFGLSLKGKFFNLYKRLIGWLLIKFNRRVIPNNF